MQQAVNKDAQKPTVVDHRLTLNEVLDWSRTSWSMRPLPSS
jgi:hypothetical protein